MSILDISNWTINEINNSINTFKDTSLTDIGMVNCDIESINIVGGITTATLWIDENIGIDGYTGAAPLKIYKEDKVEIKLNSPLLEGDTIEVVDGKLCHVHRCGKVVTDGSEDEYISEHSTLNNIYRSMIRINNIKPSKRVMCDRLPSNVSWASEYSTIFASTDVLGLVLKTDIASNINEVRNWLQQNPLTVIYELIEPYYEDITPLQSSIILKTFLESSMIINTNLPIKTNVSYRTNVPSISTLSNRVAEVSESDNVIHNLINIIDDEVDE